MSPADRATSRSTLGRSFAWAWLLVPVLGVVELTGHFVTASRVPTHDDWSQAAAFVRGELTEQDAIVTAPEWTDPLLRLHLGDAMTFARAGMSDLAPFERLWVLSIRGHDSSAAPSDEPAVSRRFGEVLVRRWDLGPSPVLYDFVQNVRAAEVTMVSGGRDAPCPWRRMGAQGGALGAGAMWPAERFQCDQARGWLWVGPTVVEDLDLRPRHCIWQHPPGLEPTRATFREVPLGERIVFYGGLYYEHERKLEHGPIYAVVRVDGEEVGRMIHRDGDGWKRMEVATRPVEDVRAHPERLGDVTIEVTAPDARFRTFCWSATTQVGPRDEPRLGGGDGAGAVDGPDGTREGTR